jgi:DNA-binding response OmpR family regulator
MELYLSRDGHKVLSASDGLTGLKLARETHPDLVVLDIMLPKMDGLTVCRTLRQESKVPIIMVTARVQEEDRLAGLDSGADDYLTKPFSPRELAARARAVLRRTARDSQKYANRELKYEALCLDIHSRSLTVSGKPVQVTPTEFRLLAMFLSEPRRVFSREQIIERVFGYEFDGSDRSIDAHMANLRRKLAQASGKHPYFQAVYGVGYRLSHA